MEKGCDLGLAEATRNSLEQVQGVSFECRKPKRLVGLFQIVLIMQ